MAKWKIPVTWEVCSTVDIEAETLEEAMRIACDEDGEIPLPTDPDYVDGSWRLSSDDEEYIRQGFNDNQTDEIINN